MSVKSSNKIFELVFCMHWIFKFIFYYFTKISNHNRLKMKTNKPTKTCSFPSGTLRSQIERIHPLLQIVCVLPMKCFYCRHVILSLQTHDYFQDRYFIISRNNDVGLILLHSYFWEELSHKNQECPPLIMSSSPDIFSSSLCPPSPPQFWFSRCSIIFCPLSLPIHLHLFSLMLDKHSHRPFFFSLIYLSGCVKP